jgi:hypothetical protein
MGINGLIELEILMTSESSSPNSVTTTNSTPSFARRHWQQIVWLVVAIVGIICIVALGFVASSPKTVPQEVQMQLMNVFLLFTLLD